MNINEFERMVDERLAEVKGELIKEFNKTYLNSVYGMEASIYPKDKTIYYFIGPFGTLVKDVWDCTPGDKQKFAVGNYFETEEEAIFEIERLKVIAELKRFAEPKDRAWDGKNEHWYFYYDYNKNVFSYNYNWCCQHSNIYFASEEDAKKVIGAVGEYRIKKYYLRVEE